jgi:hypothetical protein
LAAERPIAVVAAFSGKEFKSKTMVFRPILVPLCLSLFVLTGCPTTRQAGSVEKSGFLGDYSLLKEGVDDRALLFYRNPETDFTAYDKILFDPITLWRPPDTDLAELDEDDAQRLGLLLYRKVKSELIKDYEFVDEPGPGVFRLRLAITEASDSIAPLNLITTIVPIGLVASGIKALATGTGAFVGEASLEGEITDSLTNELLIAAVDRRVGMKTPSGSWSSWDDVEEAYDYWAQRIRERLAEERKRARMK